MLSSRKLCNYNLVLVRIFYLALCIMHTPEFYTWKQFIHLLCVCVLFCNITIFMELFFLCLHSRPPSLTPYSHQHTANWKAYLFHYFFLEIAEENCTQVDEYYFKI